MIGGKGGETRDGVRAAPERVAANVEAALTDSDGLPTGGTCESGGIGGIGRTACGGGPAPGGEDAEADYGTVAEKTGPLAGATGPAPGAEACGVDLYLLAGIKTWPTYFREPAERLKRLLAEAGYAIAEAHVLYPYGDHTIPMLRQVRQVTRDVMRRLAPVTDLAPRPGAGAGETGRPVIPPDAEALETGARPGMRPLLPRFRSAAEARLDRLVDMIRGRSAGRIVVLVGHSGGGVAACHAGRRLLAEGAVRDLRIVQIGSPKVRIHPALRDRTAYFYAADERGRVRDPITRLGTWGGVRLSAAGIPVWDSRRWAPGHIAPVAIEGGHKDYFLPSAGAPGRAANLERTAAAILDWLVRSLQPVAAAPPDRPETRR
ncbi:MAG: hypothetical protein A9Z00_08045 [Thermobacillus sp. ZCTH02-B1]|uniref:hypothetical protein n=1 Tax=Thermobacillus sp. ZCTH02-B1 TaxID=1858795 RepID=UPI000B585586|nr:hypothetical protein [Thermobacillus sp. ZCTH02-B1]OUM95307.1 MAG: hypothetical protein A9Z00_08045 [Thermobacillus sp. ZCTH02-B1]